MLRIPYFLKLLITYVSRYKGLILLGVFSGILIFFTVRLILQLRLKTTEERVGIVGRFSANELPSFILEMIGDGLTQLNESGIAEPNLASSWETPDKGKTWIFHIKKGKNWQDKTEVTSETISYDFDQVQFEKPDEYTVVFKLEEEFIPFPVVVSKTIFRKGLLGTGDWSVKKIIVQGDFISQLVLAKNDERKIIKFFPTTEQAKIAYKLGQVDSLLDLPEATPFDTWKTTKIIKKPDINKVVLAFFNTQDRFLSEKILRQALAYALDKEKMGERAFAPIAPSSWAYNPNVKQYNFDQNRAKELIKELDEKFVSEITINLITNPFLLETAEAISKNWNDIGIKTSVQVSPIIPTEFQVYLTVLDIPKDPDQYLLWHSTQTATNISKYQDPRIDKLLEDGRRQLDINERRKIYLDFQRFLLEDAPAVFLYHPTYYTITRK